MERRGGEREGESDKEKQREGQIEIKAKELKMMFFFQCFIYDDRLCVVLQFLKIKSS